MLVAFGPFVFLFVLLIFIPHAVQKLKFYLAHSLKTDNTHETFEPSNDSTTTDNSELRKAPVKLNQTQQLQKTSAHAAITKQQQVAKQFCPTKRELEKTEPNLNRALSKTGTQIFSHQQIKHNVLTNRAPKIPMVQQLQKKAAQNKLKYDQVSKKYCPTKAQVAKQDALNNRAPKIPMVQQLQKKAAQNKLKYDQVSKKYCPTKAQVAKQDALNNRAPNLKPSLTQQLQTKRDTQVKLKKEQIIKKDCPTKRELEKRGIYDRYDKFQNENVTPTNELNNNLDNDLKLKEEEEEEEEEKQEEKEEEEKLELSNINNMKNDIALQNNVALQNDVALQNELERLKIINNHLLLKLAEQTELSNESKMNDLGNSKINNELTNGIINESDNLFQMEHSIDNEINKIKGQGQGNDKGDHNFFRLTTPDLKNQGLWLTQTINHNGPNLEFQPFLNLDNQCWELEFINNNWVISSGLGYRLGKMWNILTGINQNKTEFIIQDSIDGLSLAHDNNEVVLQMEPKSTATSSWIIENV